MCATIERSHRSTGWIGVAIGDPSGIGPEVTLKALAAESPAEATRYLLFGDARLLSQLNGQLGLDLPLQAFTSFQQAGRFFVPDPQPDLVPGVYPPGSPAAAHAALHWLEQGARGCLRGELDALVTAPVNKEAILRSGRPFVGQTELLSEISGTSRTAMMLLGHDDRGQWLRVVLVTTHLPLHAVASAITSPKVELAIVLAAEACRKLDLGRARIGVCGLNPHAGEGGKLGTEERDVIAPAVQRARDQQIDVTGPWAADTLFYQAYRGDYDVVVAMYHDQGLGPLKMIGFENGVNWTLGLPFVRTSPDHGTAYDLAGRGLASATSMQSALRLARQLTQGCASSTVRV